MQEYFEELWRRLPADAEPSDFELRRHYLVERVGDGERVLDIGCGAGQFCAALDAAGARVTGVDVARAAIDRARASHPCLDFRAIAADRPLPFEDNSYEVVWAGEVIEHVADTATWLSEVRRVLAPRGRLLLSTPSHGRLLVAVRGIEHFSQPLGDHLHLYTRRSLKRLLGEFGFGEVDVRTAGGLPLMRRLLLARAVR